MTAIAPPAPRPTRNRVRRLARFFLVCVALVAFSLVVCRSMFGRLFRVTSGSMEPTIMTGESVFLLFDDDVPNRFDIVAFTNVGGGALIKRAHAVPGEKVRIDASGDLRIEGQTLPDAPNRPPLIPMFDSRLQSIGDHWRHGGSAIDPWFLVEGVEPGVDEIWEMDGSAVGRGKNLGLLRLHDRIDDGRLLPDGARLAGRHVVHDVAVSFEIFVVEAGGRLRIQVTDQGDVFEATIPVYAGEDEARIDVIRTYAAVRPDYMVVGRTSVPLGTWIPVRMQNIDNRLTFEFAGTKLSVDYDRNTPHATAYDLKPLSPGERVRIGGEGVVLRVRNILVERDFHIVPRGKYAVDHDLLLGPDEIFVLGDASSVSRDSRDTGPVEMKRVFGRAKSVVLPLEQARKLR